MSLSFVLPSARTSIYSRSVCSFVRPSVRPSVRLSVYPYIFPLIHPPTHRSIYLYAHSLTYLSSYLPTYFFPLEIWYSPSEGSNVRIIASGGLYSVIRCTRTAVGFIRCLIIAGFPSTLRVSLQFYCALRILDIPPGLKKYIYVASNLLGGNSHSINGPNLRSSNRIFTSLRFSDPGVTLSMEQRGDQTKAVAAVKAVCSITGKLVFLVVGQGAG